MIDERFINYDVNIETCEVFSLLTNKFIKPYKLNNDYLVIDLRINKVKKSFLLHRLIWMVANQAEIPEGYHIHHIDGDKHNNSIYNLELKNSFNHISEHSLGHSLTHTEETKRKISESHKGNKNWLGKKHTEETKAKISSSKSKKVVQMDINNNFIKIWDSASQAEKEGGFCQTSISSCCLNKQKTHKNYIWMFDNEKEAV